MPYAASADLPAPIRKALPAHAQLIYRKAFTNAWRQYADAAKRKRGGTREEVANRVAWAAVKRKYQKRGTRWVRKGG